MMDEYEEQLRLHKEIDYSVLRFLHSEKPKFLFGAGKQAVNCLYIFNLLDIKMDGILVTEKQNDYLSEIPIFEYQEFNNKQDIAVMIAVSEHMSNEIAAQLNNSGYNNVFCCCNWEKTNSAVKEVFFYQYLNKREVKFKDKYIYCAGSRFINPLFYGQEFRQLIYGTAFTDIILPMAFHDYSYVSAGTYEDYNFTIGKDDIVVDVGANAGVFSVLAAKKAKKVYAIEASPTAIMYLSKNLEYSNVEMIECTVGNQTGRGFFYDRPDYCKYSTMIKTHGMEYWKKEVDIVTLDYLFADRQIPVSFLKINVNGDEYNILLGAQRTIKKYRPRIVVAIEICNDYEKIVKLVNSYDDGYKFYLKKGRLYFIPIYSDMESECQFLKENNGVIL